jgi:hypothetical protein
MLIPPFLNEGSKLVISSFCMYIPSFTIEPVAWFSWNLAWVLCYWRAPEPHAHQLPTVSTNNYNILDGLNPEARSESVPLLSVLVFWAFKAVFLKLSATADRNMGCQRTRGQHGYHNITFPLAWNSVQLRFFVFLRTVEKLWLKLKFWQSYLILYVKFVIKIVSLPFPLKQHAYHSLKNIGSSSNCSDLYFVVAWFEFRPEHRLSSLRSFVAFLSASR